MTSLLDTCILIDYLRGRDPAVRYLEGLEAPPTISVITIMELTAGTKGSKEENSLSRLFSALTIFGVDQPISELAGRYLKQFAASHGVDPPDALIAATSQHHGLGLVTHNIKHFPMFEGLKRPYRV